MTYQTRDSETAYVLASQKQKFTSELRGVEVWFLFENKRACESIMTAHSNRDLVISLLDLTNSIREIKKIIINLTRK